MLSRTSTSSMSPPSLLRNGRIFSRAYITLLTVCSCIIILLFKPASGRTGCVPCFIFLEITLRLWCFSQPRLRVSSYFVQLNFRSYSGLRFCKYPQFRCRPAKPPGGLHHLPHDYSAP